MTNLPDITSHQNPEIHGSLDWVGMNGITVPLQFEDSKLGVNNIEARVNTYVKLGKPKGERHSYVSPLPSVKQLFRKPNT